MGWHRALRRAIARALTLGAFLAGIWAPSLALGQVNDINNEGLALIPLYILDNNSTDVSDLYVYIHGIVTKTTTGGLPPNTAVYVSDLDGNVRKTPKIASPSGELALNLGSCKGTGDICGLWLPKMIAIRIYVSRGTPLKVVGEAGSLPDPLGLGWNPAGANYNTIFDWAELTWVDIPNVYNPPAPRTNLGGNVTQVDMFGMPMYLSMNGTDPATSNTNVTFNAGYTVNRPTIINPFQSAGPPWSNLILSNGSTRLRVIAPYHAMEAQLNLFPTTFLDSYINQVWTFYATNQATAHASCSNDGGIDHTYTGQTAGGFFVFRESGQPKFQFPKPTTLTVFKNEIHPVPTPTVDGDECRAGVVAAALGGALMRTSAITNTNFGYPNGCDASKYYVTAPVNVYAQIFHQLGVDNKAYAFGYDDTCSQSSYIGVDDPQFLAITLGGVP